MALEEDREASEKFVESPVIPKPSKTSRSTDVESDVYVKIIESDKYDDDDEYFDSTQHVLYFAYM